MCQPCLHCPRSRLYGHCRSCCPPRHWGGSASALGRQTYRHVLQGTLGREKGERRAGLVLTTLGSGWGHPNPKRGTFTKIQTPPPETNLTIKGTLPLLEIRTYHMSYGRTLLPRRLRHCLFHLPCTQPNWRGSVRKPRSV